MYTSDQRNTDETHKNIPAVTDGGSPSKVERGQHSRREKLVDRNEGGIIKKNPLLI